MEQFSISIDGWTNQYVSIKGWINLNCRSAVGSKLESIILNQSFGPTVGLILKSIFWISKQQLDQFQSVSSVNLIGSWLLNILLPQAKFDDSDGDHDDQGMAI